MDKQGLLMCARYAASPNFFGYCGPKKSSNIVDHLKEDAADSELSHILSEFETLYPYLQLIAKENNISDSYNRRVVEAYWLGNSLLKNIKNSHYLSFLKEKLLLEKKLDIKAMFSIKKKIFTDNFIPHHTFHVFNIFKSSAKDASFKTIEAMDECRIACGEIQNSKLKIQNDNAKLKINNILLIKTKPLVMIKNRLHLGEPLIKEIKFDYGNKQFIKDLKPGNWLSFHWGMVCDVINEKQVKNLEFYTQKAIDFYNN